MWFCCCVGLFTFAKKKNKATEFNFAITACCCLFNNNFDLNFKPNFYLKKKSHHQMRRNALNVVEVRSSKRRCDNIKLILAELASGRSFGGQFLLDTALYLHE